MTDLELGQKHAAPSIARIERLEGVLLRAKHGLLGADAATKVELAKVIKKAKKTLEGMAVDRAFAMATPKQLEALGAFMRKFEEGCEEYNILHLTGGNQSGKTFIAAAIVAFWLIYFSKPGDIVWCISPKEEKSIATQQKDLWNLIPKEYFGPEQIWNEKTGFGARNPLFVFEPQGRRVTVAFKTLAQYEADERSLESEKLNGLWIDESVTQGFHDKIQMRRIAKNAWEIFSSIPDVDWTEEAFDEAKPEDRVKNITLLPSDNPIISEKMLAQMAGTIKDEDERNMRLFGIRRERGARVFKSFERSRHVIRASQVPEGLTFYAGLDIGLDHPTVWLLVGVSQSGVMYAVKEYCQRGSEISTDCAVIKGILLVGGVNYPGGYRLADSSYIDPSCFFKTKANTQTVGDQYRAHGLPVRAAVRTATIGEMALMRGINEMICADQFFVSEECPELIRNLRAMKFKRTASGAQTSSDQMEDKNNDAYDALKYVFGRKPKWFKGGIPDRSQVEAIEW